MKTLTMLFAAMLPAAAFAQDGLTLADLDKDAGLAAAYAKMAQGRTMPDWLRTGAVVTPAVPVRFGGREWLAMTACKPHDCAAHQIAVVYAEGGPMHGVISDQPEENGPQSLTWLNIGGGAESIDGRTILFAALTGSLENHPEAFTFPE
ncbi:Ivy family c-type lysozyme inhibitor [Paracoccus shanxieyensis]|uniref:C-lysozyme inhibitor n=1 Tax=Paracoccus shanxieyensis TaxID=2675752 RepID=A0A6L6IY09_9RHOB|nr:Ivy family c-type lysozyme inhibitor [Paracoccus shanxieyensis]MTH65123.1 C-lysozyme inhibitor [Paracoccus shanxieyensis]MTH88267.1 C-lysozyme inhibitor [Paracoccus shanxieyensis]